MNGNKDCRDCIHSGRIEIGKILCMKGPAEWVDPDCSTGTYPYATDCPHYQDKDGNRNADAGPCPNCRSDRIVQETGSGYHKIKCCNCGLECMDRHPHLVIAKWNGGEQ